MVEEQNQVVGRPDKAFRDYVAPTLEGNISSVLRPIMNNFETKPACVTMIKTSIQVERHPNDDPHVHINKFLGIYELLKINRVRDNAIRLKLFSFSLQDKAKS